MSVVAGAETIGEFGKGKTRAELGKFSLSIANIGKMIKDFGDFLNAVFDDVSREGDISFLRL